MKNNQRNTAKRKAYQKDSTFLEMQHTLFEGYNEFCDCKF